MTDAIKQQGTPMDFVYAGRRITTEGTLAHAIYPLAPNGDPLKETAFLYGAKVFGRGGLSIGVVYRGASFDETKAYGLQDARWHGFFAGGKDRVIQWEAADNETMATLAAERLEKSHKGEVEETLLPLRKAIHAMRKRGAHSDAHALVQMVMAEMYRPLTVKEKEE